MNVWFKFRFFFLWWCATNWRKDSLDFWWMTDLKIRRRCRRTICIKCDACFKAIFCTICTLYLKCRRFNFGWFYTTAMKSTWYNQLNRKGCATKTKQNVKYRLVKILYFIFHPVRVFFYYTMLNRSMLNIYIKIFTFNIV